MIGVLVMPSSGSSDKYEKACPVGSKCYGAKGNYSAMGYRGCIRTFDCDVQINMVPQKKKLSGGFDFSYFVCIRAPNSTLTMYFTTEFNTTEGEGMVHAKVKVTDAGEKFMSFIKIGGKTKIIDPTIETANMSSGFHLSNKHLVKVKGFDVQDRGMSDHSQHGEVHAAEGIPILNCQSMVMFFSQDTLFYTDSTSGKNVSELKIKRASNLYLKIRLVANNANETANNVTEIAKVSITLVEPGSGRKGIIFIIVIAILVILSCTKCCNCFSCFWSCCSKKKEATGDVEAQEIES
jgi:hypothetical protein